MTKREELRRKVWFKYNKHCAYCGKEIEYKNMQVDHLKPKAFAPFPNDKNAEVNSFRNLMPSCRRCNHYKRQNNLEQFRWLMKTLHERIQSQYITKVAIDYGIVEIKPFNGTFYFEVGINPVKEKGEVNPSPSSHPLIPSPQYSP